ncbi:GTP-binding protein A [Mycena sanguinolenta]|uniref:GTP-binding protein A n=1 Tax=Mycena sanguinolenta TaxID=230812 RepID=A0A8H6YFC6_9AGAR|nr:GTP-binding protein A [Mycena sanguinolenta]
MAPRASTRILSASPRRAYRGTRNQASDEDDVSQNSDVSEEDGVWRQSDGADEDDPNSEDDAPDEEGFTDEDDDNYEHDAPDEEDSTDEGDASSKDGTSKTDRAAEDDEVTIAVMGMTGTGKTTFINLLSGAKLHVGHKLTSCTENVAVTSPFRFEGRSVTLIDTPGFDDTKQSQMEILSRISVFLGQTYKAGKKLAGVIYLHRITDNRMGGIACQNFRMFRQLCGDQAFKNVVIVTTMWGQIERTKGLDREKELMNGKEFYKHAVTKGAHFMRHDKKLVSAQAVLRSLMKNTPLPLKIQREIVDEGKDITETAAGAEFNREITAQIQQLKTEMENLRRGIKDAARARDSETKKELEMETKELRDKMSRMQSDAQNFASNYERLNAEMDRKLAEAAERAARDEERHRLAMAESEREEAKRQSRGGIFSRVGRALDTLVGFRF